MTPRHQALVIARDAIAEGRNTMICLALYDNCPEELMPAVKEIAEEIMRGLTPKVALGNWLWAQGISATHEQRRMARLAWIDKMIDNLKEFDQSQ
jgi:hypothetical protein